MDSSLIAIIIGLVYGFGVIATILLNIELCEYDPFFPVIAVLWFLWPFTLTAYLFFYFLIPIETRKDSKIIIFRWFYKNKK